ncbi:MAG TPA: c-type cytochrome biogenesis protein CcmI [Xanthobacteraceae bacterium]|jgi:cytochrome c-type biogenesis protein CcmH|nr:c-type cytochrome biogenesis protein CcmI [Xanthobacteraceae bacterium]
MLFWFLIAAMTGAAVFSVLWPLGARRAAAAPANADLMVYRDQLAELDHDRARGLLAEPEAEAARAEIARRLIGVAKKNAGRETSIGSPMRRRLAGLAALTVVPAVALLFYLSLGSPYLSEVNPRPAVTTASEQVAMLLARIEKHLAEHPDDGKGWEVVAPVYTRLDRTEDAVKARANALRLLGETAGRQADLGEALVTDARGVVTADARKAFARADALEAGQPKARFFLGLAAEQDGRKDDAEKIWREMLNSAPQDAPYLPAVREALEQLRANRGQRNVK